MWPWGHAAVGYLLSSGYTRWTGYRPLDGSAATVVVLAALLPDLIDKPLGWTFGVLPGGRTLGHSMVFFLLVVTAGAWLARVGHPEIGAALGIGHGSHLIAYLPLDVAVGNFEGARYLLWPVIGQPDYEPPAGILIYILTAEWVPYDVFQVALFAVAAEVWIRDGMPGVETVTSLGDRVRTRSRS